MFRNFPYRIGKLFSCQKVRRKKQERKKKKKVKSKMEYVFGDRTRIIEKKLISHRIEIERISLYTYTCFIPIGTLCCRFRFVPLFVLLPLSSFSVGNFHISFAFAHTHTYSPRRIESLFGIILLKCFSFLLQWKIQRPLVFLHQQCLVLWHMMNEQISNIFAVYFTFFRLTIKQKESKV